MKIHACKIDWDRISTLASEVSDIKDGIGDLTQETIDSIEKIATTKILGELKITKED